MAFVLWLVTGRHWSLLYILALFQFRSIGHSIALVKGDYSDQMMQAK